MPEAPAPRVDAGVLSPGGRPAELDRALRSLLAPRDVAVRIVCVGNGWEPSGLPDGVQGLHVPENVGAPEGRNLGSAVGDAPFVFYLDDDAWLPEDDALRRLIDVLARPGTGLVQARIMDPADGRTESRWVPRLRTGSPSRSGPVTAVVEGACAIRRSALERAGGWAGPFVYGHEGIELAWRVWDQGLAVQYVGDVVAAHPGGAAFRRPSQMRLNARNRAWLVRRNLPWPLGPLHLSVWCLITRWRLRRDRETWQQWRAGLTEGLRQPAGERRPIRWRTVWRLTTLGRPPVI